MLTLILAVGLAQSPTGAAVYENRCATCHAGTDPRTPTLASLKQKTPQAIVDALTNGVMRQQGSDMTDAEKRAVAAYLGTTTPSAPAASTTTAASDPTAGACTSTPPFDPSKGPQWNGWGVDVTNQRFQPAAQAGLTADQVPKLKLKWAFGFPNANSARGLPTIVGGRVFVGSMSGTVYALDAKSGCVIWTFKETPAGVLVEIQHTLHFRVAALATLAEPIIGRFFVHHVANQTLRVMKEKIEGAIAAASAQPRFA